MKNQLVLHAAVVTVVAAVVYILTAAPGLYYTDSGELAAASSVWGVAHPTGYPLFTFLAHVWTYLPFSSVVGGLNIFSALTMASAVGVLVVCTARILERTVPSLSTASRLIVADASALLFAFSSTAWAQGTSVEVHALNTLLFTLALLFLTNANSKKNTIAAALMIGGMLANHLSSVFLIPGLLVFWWLQQPSRSIALKLLPWAVVPTMLCGSLYALLPMRSAQSPTINWGFVHRGWDEFLYHVKGTQFGVWMFSEGEAARIARDANASLFGSLATEQLLWLGWIVVVIALVVLWKQWKPLAFAAVLVVGGNLTISFGYAIADIDPYFLPTLVILAVFVAVGLGHLVRNTKREVVVTLLALPVIPLVLNYSQADLSNHRAVEGYTKWTLANAEPNAVIFTHQWDFLCSAFWYEQVVNGTRTDVAMIDKELLRRTWYIPYLQQRYPHVMKGAEAEIEAFMPWLESFERDSKTFTSNPQNNAEIQQRFVALLNSIVTSNAHRPIYITPEMINEEQGFAAGYDAIPVGPLLRLTNNPSVIPETSLSNLDPLLATVASPRNRLDSALNTITMSALATSALYTAQVVGDTAKYKSMYRALQKIDESGRALRALDQRIGPIR